MLTKSKVLILLNIVRTNLSPNCNSVTNLLNGKKRRKNKGSNMLRTWTYWNAVGQHQCHYMGQQ